MPVVLTAPVMWFGAAVTFAFLLTFDKTFRHSFAPLMTRVADIGFGGFHGHGSVHPFGFLNGIVHDVNEWTRQGMLGCERAMSWSIEMMRATLHELTLTVASMAENYKAAFDNVWHEIQHVVPKVVHQTIVRPVQKAAQFDATKIRTRLDHLGTRLDRLKLRIGALAAAIAGAIAAPFPRLGKVEKDVTGAAKWVKNLRYLAKYATIAALGAAILAKLGLGWFRCPSITKNLRKRHCIDSDLLDALLTGTLLIVGTVSLVEFAKEVGAVTEEANGLIHGFLRDV